MRIGRGEHTGSDILGDADGVVAEELCKIYHGIAERVFESPTPVLTRAFRGRRPSGFDEEAQEEDDDDDDSGVDTDEAPDVDVERSSAAVWGIRDVSLRIPRGAAVALVGGSGSGKTTLLGLLGGAIPPTSGRAILAGRPSPLINVSLQLMAPTIGPAANAAVAASLVGVTKRRLRPHLERIFALAGVAAGDRRVGITRSPYQVAVATAIELGSEVLLLDDPFASATADFRARILEAVEQRREAGATLLLETRDREALRCLCDQAIWLDQGSVVRTGGIDEILAAHDASAAVARAAAPYPEPVAGFNETAAIVSGSGEAQPDGRVSIAVRLELSRASVTLQTGVGLRGDDGVGLWFEQPDPVICELPGFHRFQLVAHDVVPGRYVGMIQARVLEGGDEAVIGRSDAFEVTVGAPTQGGRVRGATTWERREASWLYGPERSTL